MFPIGIIVSRWMVIFSSSFSFSFFHVQIVFCYFQIKKIYKKNYKKKLNVYIVLISCPTSTSNFTKFIDKENQNPSTCLTKTTVSLILCVCNITMNVCFFFFFFFFLRKCLFRAVKYKKEKLKIFLFNLIRWIFKCEVNVDEGDALVLCALNSLIVSLFLFQLGRLVLQWTVQGNYQNCLTK